MQRNRVQPYTAKNNYNTSFQAKFREKDIELILDTVNQSSMRKELIPQVYTMLKFIDEEVPGKIAKIQEKVENLSSGYSKFYSTSVLIDSEKEPVGVFSSTTKSSHAIIEALENMCIFNRGNNASKNHVRMPHIIFDMEWWKNRKVTEQSIRNLSYEHQFIKKI